MGECIVAIPQHQSNKNQENDTDKEKTLKKKEREKEIENSLKQCSDFNRRTKNERERDNLSSFINLRISDQAESQEERTQSHFIAYR